MVSDRAFFFHIYIPWRKILSLVPKSGSSVKVKCQGHSFQKNGCSWGISVSHAHVVLTLSSKHRETPSIESHGWTHGWDRQTDSRVPSPTCIHFVRM